MYLIAGAAAAVPGTPANAPTRPTTHEAHSTPPTKPALAALLSTLDLRLPAAPRRRAASGMMSLPPTPRSPPGNDKHRYSERLAWL